MLNHKISKGLRRILFTLKCRKSKQTSNIYHCCFQKTATQWFRMVFSDKIFLNKTGFPLYTPGENFITEDRTVLQELHHIPRGVIVSPFYITAKNFAAHTANTDYRAFYITRDPRDVIISSYFSLRYSHAKSNAYIETRRKELAELSEHDGIMKTIRELARFISEIMLQWKQAENDRIRIFAFEDVFGPGQEAVLAAIMQHCRLPLAPEDIRDLAARYAFDRISGRRQGEEDRKNHYRKGISGDWLNYFSDAHKGAFKEQAGELLIGLGYEKNLNW
jgi:hypothetical protein